LVAAVLLRQADLLDRFAEDMRHFALKRDGLQRHLTTKEEAVASERALRVLVGNPRAQQGPEAPRSRLQCSPVSAVITARNVVSSSRNRDSPFAVCPASLRRRSSTCRMLSCVAVIASANRSSSCAVKRRNMSSSTHLPGSVYIRDFRLTYRGGSTHAALCRGPLR
jgi:hypothetical protein